MYATVITAYESERDEFQLTEGYQPINSLFYLYSGSFQCEINEKKEIVRAGEIAVFDSRTPMRRHVLAPIRFLYIKYATQNESLLPICSGVYRSISSRACEDLAQISLSNQKRGPLALSLATHYFNDLLLCILQKQPTEQDRIDLPKLPSGIDRPIAYLRSHLTQKLLLSDVAQDAGMSISSLESKFKSLMGCSVYRFFISLRMELATQLLIETAYPITEIAKRCGYENLFYFCNVFKREIGMTPSQFRIKNRI